MKQFNIFAAAMVGMMACATSAFAQSTVVNLNDYHYQMIKFEKNNYTDHIVYNVGDAPEEFTAGSIAKHGAYIGATLGGQFFDRRTTPMGGVVVGWEGGPRTPLKFEGNVNWTVGHYTRQADRDNRYASVDTRLIGAVCLYTSPNKQWRWWAGGYFGYKLNFDFHEGKSVSTSVQETAEAIITISEEAKKGYTFKGSTMGGGAYTEVSYTPFMSKISYRAFLGVGAQQRFYADGASFHPEVFAGVKVCYNFSVAELWDKAFLQKVGLSKRQAKKMSKDRTTVKNY